MNLVQSILVRVFLAGAVSQFFFAGAGVFGASSFDTHKAVGDGLIAISLLIAILSLAQRRNLALGSGLFALMLLQWFLANQAPGISSWLAALHPLNGLAVLGTAAGLLRALPLPSRVVTAGH
jgi:hypothetical protein